MCNSCFYSTMCVHGLGLLMNFTEMLLKNKSSNLINISSSTQLIQLFLLYCVCEITPMYPKRTFSETKLIFSGLEPTIQLYFSLRCVKLYFDVSKTKQCFLICQDGPGVYVRKPYKCDLFPEFDTSTESFSDVFRSVFISI